MTSASAAGFESLCVALIAGYDVAGWWPARTRFEVLAGAILVQNTRWTNVAKALERLRVGKVLEAGALASLSPARIARLIRPAGCQRIKARRLAALSRWVVAQGGLASLAQQDTASLRHALLEIHGIGPETADAMLCYAFDRPRFIADRYARRWIARSGAAGVAATASYEACQRFVDVVLAGSRVDLAELHAAIVMHSQGVCRQTPLCDDCVVRYRCARAGV